MKNAVPDALHDLVSAGDGRLREVDSLAGLDLLRRFAQELDGWNNAPTASARPHLPRPAHLAEEARDLAQVTEHSLEQLLKSDKDINDLAGNLIRIAERADATAPRQHASLDALLAGFFRYEGHIWVQWGRLDAFTHTAWVERGPTPLLFRLIAIAGEKCEIERENHGSWGYHYHYLDHKGRRSDVIFSFLPTDTNTPARLWWERHGEGKAAFSPDVQAWGASKRTSIHGACERDLRKRKLADYKCPSKEALALWPIP